MIVSISLDLELIHVWLLLRSSSHFMLNIGTLKTLFRFIKSTNYVKLLWTTYLVRKWIVLTWIKMCLSAPTWIFTEWLNFYGKVVIELNCNWIEFKTPFLWLLEKHRDFNWIQKSHINWFKNTQFSFDWRNPRIW